MMEEIDLEVLLAMAIDACGSIEIPKTVVESWRGQRFLVMTSYEDKIILTLESEEDVDGYIEDQETE